MIHLKSQTIASVYSQQQQRSSLHTSRRQLNLRLVLESRGSRRLSLAPNKNTSADYTCLASCFPCNNRYYLLLLRESLALVPRCVRNRARPHVGAIQLYYMCGKYIYVCVCVVARMISSRALAREQEREKVARLCPFLAGRRFVTSRLRSFSFFFSGFRVLPSPPSAIIARAREAERGAEIVACLICPCANDSRGDLLWLREEN